MAMLFDYTTLRLVWWALLGVLLIGFALTDGWDLGIGALLPFVARSDVERRMAINVAAPTWEGNQVWFILGGGAIFAAWPFVYAASFSGFYLAMFLVLAALILRPVGFKYRSKRTGARWRAAWDWGLFVGGFVPALVFGVAVGNVLRGIPIRLDGDLRLSYDGTLWGLFTALPLLCGLLSVAMMMLHGACYLGVRVAPGPVHDRARLAGSVAAMAVIVLFAAGGILVAWGGFGYAVSAMPPTDGPSNPLWATTVPMPGAWIDNFRDHIWMIAAPALGFLGAAIAFVGLRTGGEAASLGGSALASTGIIATVGLSMFPVILPSSVDAHASLLVWNASSSRHTLAIMLVCTVIFLPIVLAYTAWVYRVIWGRVTPREVATNPDFY